MEKTSKAKRRLNVIDVLIIMLILALLATVGYRVYAQISENGEGEKSDFVIVFESDAEYRSMIKTIKNGDEVLLSRKKVKVAPGEMESLTLKASLLEGVTDLTFALEVEEHDS